MSGFSQLEATSYETTRNDKNKLGNRQLQDINNQLRQLHQLFLKRIL